MEKLKQNEEIRETLIHYALLSKPAVWVCRIIIHLISIISLGLMIGSCLVIPFWVAWQIKGHIKIPMLSEAYNFATIAAFLYMVLFVLAIYLVARISRFDFVIPYEKIFKISDNEYNKVIHREIEKHNQEISRLQKGWTCNCPECVLLHINADRINFLKNEILFLQNFTK